MPEIFTDRWAALAEASRSGKDVMLRTDYGLKIVQPDGITYFLKSNKPKLRVVKKNKGGLIKTGHTDYRKTGLFK